MATHTAEINIHAPQNIVFDALTQPELIKQWQFGRILSTDWKEGSEIKFKTETPTKTLEQWGTVLEIKTNELIKYNLFTPAPGLNDLPENYCVTSYVLTADQDQTNVQIIQEDHRPEGFTPVSLSPVLAALKQTIEQA